MKVKTSLSLSDDLLEELDRVSAGEPRSAFIERILRSYLRRRARAEADSRDLELINAAAEYFDEEMADILTYQVIPDEPPDR
jgi:metal-responsive CopG/Arc/MetJ family transcriptional regulator